MNFSILIPTLNEEKYLGTLLGALASQTEKNFEVVVVDGHSTDRTGKVALKYQKKLKLRFFKAKKRGVSFQRNFAAGKAKHSHLIFFDADVKPSPNFIKEVREILEKRDLDSLTTWNVPLSENKADKIIFYTFDAFYLSGLKKISPGAVGTFIYIKKEVFQALGGFRDEVNFGEDFELVRRLHREGYSFDVFRQPAISFSTRRLEKEGRVNFLKKMIKAGLRFQLTGALPAAEEVIHQCGNFS